MQVREIDRVVVKGSSSPIGLFSYDLTLERLQADDMGLFATAPLGWGGTRRGAPSSVPRC